MNEIFDQYGLIGILFVAAVVAFPMAGLLMATVKLVYKFSIPFVVAFQAGFYPSLVQSFLEIVFPNANPASLLLVSCVATIVIYCRLVKKPDGSTITGGQGVILFLAQVVFGFVIVLAAGLAFSVLGGHRWVTTNTDDLANEISIQDATLMHFPFDSHDTNSRRLQAFKAQLINQTTTGTVHALSVVFSINDTNGAVIESIPAELRPLHPVPPQGHGVIDDRSLDSGRIPPKFNWSYRLTSISWKAEDTRSKPVKDIKLLASEISKLEGKASINREQFVGRVPKFYINCNIYNGSEIALTSITIEFELSSDPPAKPLRRKYLLKPKLRAGKVDPLTTGDFVAELGIDPEQRKWTWAIVGATGVRN